MKLTSPSVLRGLLQEYGIRLNKGLGQHFLCDDNILHKIIEAAELSGNDLVIEPGAGLGTLTLGLAAEAGEVIAVELDYRLIPGLQASIDRSQRENVMVLNQDFLRLNLKGLLAALRKRQAKVVGNLPYGITSPILAKLMEEREGLSLAVLMIQYELAQKLVAAPGPLASALGVQLQSVAQVQLLARVRRTVFYPPPEVDSALIKLTFLKTPRFHGSEEVFSRVIRAAFNLRRKTIKRALVRSPHLLLPEEVATSALHEVGIDGQRRGESLAIEEFDRLAQALQRMGEIQGS